MVDWEQLKVKLHDGLGIDQGKNYTLDWELIKVKLHDGLGIAQGKNDNIW